MNIEHILALGIYKYLILSSTIFIIGVIGVFLNRNSVIMMLMSIELMLLAANINFVAFSHYNHNIHGQIFSLMTLATIAAESAVGLAIIVIHHKNNKSIITSDINNLKG